MRVDANGNKLWEQTFGGSGDDSGDINYVTHLLDIVRTSDGGFLLSGASGSSTTGTKTSPRFGGADYWVLKLAPEPPHVRVGARQPDGLPLIITALPNCNYVIQCATTFPADPSAWTDVATIANPTGQVQWVDPEAGNAPTRFYRAAKQ